MGSADKTKPVNIYGAMLKLYPQSFQRHYGTTMQQTFRDMLDGEHTILGRSLVWLRTLVDLPFSATKEHITDGKELPMNRLTKIIIAGAIVAIVIIGTAAYWAGNLHARNNVGIDRVTTAQLADAMQQDDFYSTYGDAAVLFSGKVAKVEAKNGASLVTFATNRPYTVICQFSKVVSFKSDQTVSIAAPTGNAERQTHGVLLHDCLEN